jgi:DNA primase catalytic subunit
MILYYTRPQEEISLPQKLCFPVNHFPPTIRQRRKFYSTEFNLQNVKNWLNHLPEPLRNPLFLVDVGTESGIVRKAFRSSLGRLLFFSLREIGELREQLVDFAPEDVYYDRNLYKDKEECVKCKKKRQHQECAACQNIAGQHVMFDIDPENINCPNCGTLGDRMAMKSMYRFCYICFKKAAIETAKLHGILLQKGYHNLEVIYSGRGFHICLEDPEAFRLSFEERDKLSKWVKDDRKIPIDPWVTRGGTRLARLPYSLHGLVGKIVTPINIADVTRIDPSRDKNLTPLSFRNESPILPKENP